MKYIGMRALASEGVFVRVLHALLDVAVHVEVPRATLPTIFVHQSLVSLHTEHPVVALRWRLAVRIGTYLPYSSILEKTAVLAVVHCMSEATSRKTERGGG